MMFERIKQNKGAVLGLVLLGSFVLVALFAPMLAPYSQDQISADVMVPPFWGEGGSAVHLLGTDDLGRDTFSRLIYGARISLGTGLLVVLLSMSIGTLLGLLAGLLRGWVDVVIMRSVDVAMSLPSILMAIVVVAVLGPGLMNGIIAVSIVALPGFIRIVRASVMAEASKAYVDASVCVGAAPIRIARVQILPNCVAPIIVQATLGFSDGILNVSALGFLGLGAQPPLAEWGAMLADSRGFIESNPWLVTLPGVCILLVVLSFNILGDGLRDALDPKLKGR